MVAKTTAATFKGGREPTVKGFSAMDSTDSLNDGSVPRLSADQYVVGIIRHQQTGAFVVFLSFDGDDIQQVAAHFAEPRAQTVYAELLQALPETYSEQQVREMLNDQLDGPKEVEAMIQEWESRIGGWREASDAPLLPFSPSQLAQVGEQIQQAFRARGNPPPLPPGTIRTTELLPDGTPRTTLRPMPPPRKRRNKR